MSGAPLDGVLVVDKPAGPTSHDVVARARRALGTRRIGHTGTLDPQATGVLPLVVGRATRLAGLLTAADKEYEADVVFGRATDTFDAAGRVTEETVARPAREAVAAALERFRGVFQQTPPAYSAKKVGGVRAYVRARQRAPLALPPVTVTVHTLEAIAWGPDRVRLRLRAAPGFYVRALAHDLGQAVGCPAHLAALRRTRAGGFGLAEAVPFEALEPGSREALRARVVPLEGLLADVPAARLTPGGLRKARHGQPVGVADLAAPAPVGPRHLVRLFAPDGQLVALAEPVGGPALLHPVIVLR